MLFEKKQYNEQNVQTDLFQKKKKNYNSYLNKIRIRTTRRDRTAEKLKNYYNKNILEAQDKAKYSS